MQPKLARLPCYPRKHITHASTPPMPPTLARIARHFSNSLYGNLFLYQEYYLKPYFLKLEPNISPKW